MEIAKQKGGAFNQRPQLDHCLGFKPVDYEKRTANVFVKLAAIRLWRRNHVPTT